ncbi:MAG: hypothetical protein AAF035_04210 [Pseudomonadota bacterium]
MNGLLSKRVLLIMGAIALLMIALAVVTVWWLRGQMHRPVWTTSTQPVEIVIGNDVFSIPANAIRFAGQRRNGNAQRVDIALLFPQGNGYSADQRGAFLETSGTRKVIFAHLEPRSMPHDMSGRLEPLYRTLFEGAARTGPANLVLQSLETGRGYEGEELAISAPQADGRAWIARCQIDDGQTVPTCLRDVHIAGGAALTYRFPRTMLAQWQAIDAMVLGRTVEFAQ